MDVTMVATEFATKYIFTRTLNTSSGRQPLPVITAIWQKDTGKDGVGFVTAYPGENIKMLKEYSQVVLTKPLPSLRLDPGDVGVVVHFYHQGRVYGVEFLTLDGNTLGVETVGAADLRQTLGDAIVHERERFAT